MIILGGLTLGAASACLSGKMKSQSQSREKVKPHTKGE